MPALPRYQHKLQTTGNANMTSSTILICTVGGSHQPIVTAIKANEADFVCFVCSGKDPGTGKAGSDTQILGIGNLIKANFNDEKPSLPNIPTQVGLTGEQFSVAICEPDNLDDVCNVCVKSVQELKAKFPGARFVADYTGGTKTMSAGLVLASMLVPGVELKLVTGDRIDLIKVRDDWQIATPATTRELRLSLEMQPFLQAWKRYAYTEAAMGLTHLLTVHGVQPHLNRARNLSQAYADWDAFAHQDALQRLQAYAPVLPPAFKSHIGLLQRLSNEQDAHKKQWARLFDLYRNAERRAAQGRYDDAVARIYRLIEWTAQWILERDLQIETGDIPADFDAAGVELTTNRDGKRQAGLYAAWALVEKKTQGAASRFFKQQGEPLKNHVNARNRSILAHGFDPIDKTTWLNLYGWLNETFIPMLCEEGLQVQMKDKPPQLPDHYPDSSP
jgi:CRISPR-associated protein (TIGR02710 family)